MSLAVNNLISSKRILSEINQDQDEFLKNKKIKTEISDFLIPCYEMDEFENLLSKVDGIDLSSRFSALGKLFGKTVLKNEKNLWLTTSDKVELFLELKEGKFCSKAFHEEAFEETGKDCKYLTMYEADENNQINASCPLFKVRLSDQYGELIWIQKGEGKGLSGSNVAKLYSLFVEKTLIEPLPQYTMYLYDDAKISVQIKRKNKSPIEKILDLKIANLWGLSWYEKLGYSIANIDNCLLELKDSIQEKTVLTKVSQDKNEYKQALENVRKMPLSKFYDIQKRYTDEMEKIRLICARIFGEDFNVVDSSKTLQDFQKSISLRARDDKNPHFLLDQCFLANLLKPYVTCKPSEEEDEFVNNLTTIHSARILSKTFLSLSNLNDLDGIRVISKPTSKKLV